MKKEILVLSKPFFQILDVLTGLKNPLQEQSGEDEKSVCFQWVNIPPPSRRSFEFYSEFLEQEFLTDLTLLVGPDQVPIKVHKLILAAHFEYFRSMFSPGLKESALNEVRLPFIGPEDFRLILKYAYTDELNLSKDNVFKVAVMANYFGSDNLQDRCCNFVKKFINLKNCLKLFEMVSQLNINQLRRNCLLFLVDKIEEVNTKDIPVEALLEIIQHPAAVIVKNLNTFGDREKHLFHLVWDRVKYFPEQKKTALIPKILKAVHLPLTDKHFLFFLLSKFEHIPGAKELIMKAGEEVHPSETREWYFGRSSDVARCMVYEHDKRVQINGIGVYEYSTCVLIKGFPFFIYVTSPFENEKEYHVDSPVAIENLGLQCRVIVMLKLDGEYVRVNTYHNGVVDRFPVRRNAQLWKDDIHIKVQLE